MQDRPYLRSDSTWRDYDPVAQPRPPTSPFYDSDQSQLQAQQYNQPHSPFRGQHHDQQSRQHQPTTPTRTYSYEQAPHPPPPPPHPHPAQHASGASPVTPGRRRPLPIPPTVIAHPPPQPPAVSPGRLPPGRPTPSYPEPRHSPSSSPYMRSTFSGADGPIDRLHLGPPGKGLTPGAAGAGSSSSSSSSSVHGNGQYGGGGGDSGGGGRGSSRGIDDYVNASGPHGPTQPTPVSSYFPETDRPSLTSHNPPSTAASDGPQDGGGSVTSSSAYMNTSRYNTNTSFNESLPPTTAGGGHEHPRPSSEAGGSSVTTTGFVSSPFASNPQPPTTTISVGPDATQTQAGPGAPESSRAWTEQEGLSPWVRGKIQMDHDHERGYYGDEDDIYDDYVSDDEDDVEEVNERLLFNPAFLSEMSVQLADRVECGNHVKGGITYPKTFTGSDLVTTIQAILPGFTRESPYDRRYSLFAARSLQSQLFVVEVEWTDRPIRDTSDDVFMFMSDTEGMGDALAGSMPSGVLTMATKCYSASCTGAGDCYSPRCPYQTSANAFLNVANATLEEITGSVAQTTIVKNADDWTWDIDQEVLQALTEDQKKRQTLIRQAIMTEEQYEGDLTTIEQVFLTPLQLANPPVIEPYHRLQTFVLELFGNIAQLRSASRRLLDNFSIRLREQEPLISTVGDIFLEAATDFTVLYHEYTDNMPRADALLTHALETHRPFAAWYDRQSRTTEPSSDLRMLLKRPAIHLQAYPGIIEGVLSVTPSDNPDHDFLSEALTSVQNISFISRLKLWHASKARGPAASLEWYDIVAPTYLDYIKTEKSKEMRRQIGIWELIKTEMEYVADLEAIDTLFITPLREAEVPVIERARVENFIDDMFHNYRSILDLHTRLLRSLQDRQIEQHPRFGMISDLMLDSVLNWHEAYMEYAPHYPIAKAKIDHEKATNPAFASFLDLCRRHPDANRQDINHFVFRPIARLQRYPMLLENILKHQKVLGPSDDLEGIPQLVEIIKDLCKATDKGVEFNTAKVELWTLKASLDGGRIGTRAVQELDLMNPMRELIHKGKVYRQPDGGIGNAWSELQLFVFDNYFVLIKQQKGTGRGKGSKNVINRRPIPLELLQLGHFAERAESRPLGLRWIGRGGGSGGGGGAGGHDDAGPNPQPPDSRTDSRTVYPFTYTIIGQGATGGEYTLWTDSENARQQWHERLRHAKVLRKEVTDANEVFQMTPLSVDTFFMPAGYGQVTQEGEFTGRVTCSVPFMSDKRPLVAVGCQEGVWIGVRHQLSSLCKVLHLHFVTQITVLEEFGIFLVLAKGTLLAYNLEALVPTAASSGQIRGQPQRLGLRDVIFFSVGQLNGRTLVVYMKRKSNGNSSFKVLEPVISPTLEDKRPRFGILSGQRSEWFRTYREFDIPCKAVDVCFLKTKLVILCDKKGFEILDIGDLRGGPIPKSDPQKIRERPALGALAKRWEGAKPLAMFRSTETEFLLCYDTFGLYVDRHGDPSRDLQAIEWEGLPERVAFHPPYVLLISPSFIEVRHIDTAKLVQTYLGSDIRCTWDGTGTRRPPDQVGPRGWGDEVTSHEPRIHICKRAEDQRRRADDSRTKGVEQNLFELTPTLLLSDALLNPVFNTTDPNYFPPAPLDPNYFPPAPLSGPSLGMGGSMANLSDMYRSQDMNAGYPPSVSSASTGNHPNGGQNYSLQSPAVAQSPYSQGAPGYPQAGAYAQGGGHQPQRGPSLGHASNHSQGYGGPGFSHRESYGSSTNGGAPPRPGSGPGANSGAAGVHRHVSSNSIGSYRR